MSSPASDDDFGPLIGAQAIARFAGLTVHEVDALAAAQQIPHRWFGSTMHASRAELREWMTQRTQAAASK